MNWVRVQYPTRRRVFMDGEPLGWTNARQFVGEDATHDFDLGEPKDYKPRSQRRRVAGSSRTRPFVVEFTPREDP